MSMDFDPRPPLIQQVITALEAAVRRGVLVTLSIDSCTFLREPGTWRLGPLWYPQGFNKVSSSFQAQYQTYERLKATANITTILSNQPARPFTNPFAGRSHIKFSVINNHLFVGGCNLTTGTYDLMVGWEDKLTADKLQQFLNSLEKSPSVHQTLRGEDQSWAIDEHTQLLIDAGERNRSTILEHALQLIDSAQDHITITCQFFPNSVTARHLAAAYKRGVQVTIAYADPAKQGKIGGTGQRISILRERIRVPAELFKLRLPKDGPLLHAKLLATDAGTMIGSHNYVQAGVLLGTAEIALISSDTAFHNAAVAALSRELAPVATLAQSPQLA